MRVRVQDKGDDELSESKHGHRILVLRHARERDAPEAAVEQLEELDHRLERSEPA